MVDVINKRKVRKQWKNFIKKETFSDYFCFYKAIQNTAKSMMLQMIDFLFIEDVYFAFLQLVELNENIDIMLETENIETINLCKKRIDFLLQNKIGEWYI